ncbi:ATP-binding cassette domain-containing protein [Actinophytocola sp.]|uniref:ATP-binding cassette domain-containing protein n=1 Tax=Actinophytocola sp. TaxID=1872138 RepID=UPI003D6A87F7
MTASIRDRLAFRRTLWVMVWRGSGVRGARVGLLVVLQGLTPTMAMVASGLLVAALPGAFGSGELTSEGAGPAMLGLALFGGALLLGAVLASIVDHQVQVLNGSYARAVHRTVTAATLHDPGVARLTEPDVTGAMAALEEFERVDGFVGTMTSLRELVQRRVTGIGAFVVLATFAWWAPVVLLAGWRGLSFGVRRWTEHGMRLASAAGSGDMRRARYLRTLAMEPAAAKEVRVFGLADWLVRGYADTYLAALRAIWQHRRLGMRTVVAATGGVLLTHLMVLGVLGSQAADGEVSVAYLVVYVQAVLGTSALGYVFGAEVPLARAREAAARALALEERLRSPRTEPAPPAPLTRPEAVTVHLRDVRFTYPGCDRPTLAGLDLVIPSGQSVAIVGTNGAGKSTLMKLLCGLYEPDAGRISISGLAPVAARGRVAAIFQRFTRYELPLRANVGFGHLALAEDEQALSAALADAGVADLLTAMPGGWDTVLSAAYPGGRDLSGGQWQKVALARALTAVRGGAGLLIMDEPTASLDVRAEADLFARFMALTRDVTTILVSHRLASVRLSDRIVVIADGRVSEDGTHDELMAAGGNYATMFFTQARRFSPGTATDPAPVSEKAANP